MRIGWNDDYHPTKISRYYQVVQTLATQVRAETLTLDTNTQKIYLSVAKSEEGSRTPVAATFKVLVYKMKS